VTKQALGSNCWNHDVLVHEYFGVGLDLLWNVVERDLPALWQKISKILEKMNAEKL